jgi:hypothetical protein
LNVLARNSKIHEQAGSALLAVLIFAGSGFALATLTAKMVHSAAQSVAARADVLCASLAVAGATRTSPSAFVTIDELQPALSKLTIETHRIGKYCVLSAEAVCGRATRRASRDVATEFCDSTAP